ncbi:hypothetical protein [Aquimonas voraii]|uniref:DUF4440 domain-containing protein n=1 Tax=Aquimonas voraii TaxID=265719 RepID=A0A1G6ZGK0_9GAMM|nr:hypothetical protein [Aquimonas voraii]SDE00836.1 hypothetical protein SAMN04488509_11377 [Aquimonas voraii]
MHLKHILLLLLLPLLAACAASGGGKPAAVASDEEQLSTRPIERWEHLIAKRPDQAWEYLSPGYRSTRDRSAYVQTMSNRPVSWLRAEYQSHTCERPGEFCAVVIKVHFRVRSRQLGVGDLESYNFLTERWIKSGGTWYHVPEEVTG